MIRYEETEYVGQWMVLPWVDVPRYHPTNEMRREVVVAKPFRIHVRPFADFDPRELVEERVFLKSRIFGALQYRAIIYATDADYTKRVEPHFALFKVAFRLLDLIARLRDEELLQRALGPRWRP